MKFQELKVGEQARLIGLETCSRAFRHQLLALGMTPGVVFRLIGHAPLGDPAIIHLRGAQVCLRAADIAQLQLERHHDD